MARNRTMVSTAIWENPEFTQLGPGAQRLYFQLITSRKATMVGLVPLSVRSWSRASVETTPDDIANALAELITHRFVVIDTDTDEAVVRTMIKHDPPKGKNLIIGTWSQILEIESDYLRAVVVNEVPEDCWSHPEATPPKAVLEIRKRVSEGAWQGATEGACEPPSQSFPHPLPTTHYPLPATSARANQTETHPTDDTFKAVIEYYVARQLKVAKNVHNEEKYSEAIRTKAIGDYEQRIRKYIADHPHQLDPDTRDLGIIANRAMELPLDKHEIIDVDGQRMARSAIT